MSTRNFLKTVKQFLSFLKTKEMLHVKGSVIPLKDNINNTHTHWAMCVWGERDPETEDRGDIMLDGGGNIILIWLKLLTEPSLELTQTNTP